MFLTWQALWADWPPGTVVQKSGTDLYFIYIHKHGNKSADEKVIKLTPTYVSFTDTPAPMVPMTVDPILGYDAAHAGQTIPV